MNEVVFPGWLFLDENGVLEHVFLAKFGLNGPPYQSGQCGSFIMFHMAHCTFYSCTCQKAPCFPGGGMAIRSEDEVPSQK